MSENKDYKIVIEEAITKAFWVEASSAEEAMDIAAKKYRNGEFVLDGDAAVSHKQMCVDVPEDEQTEWTRF